MLYFQPRYIKTKNNRILKLDGWNPLVELSDFGLWVRPKNIDNNEIINSNEITQADANKNSLYSDDLIDSDNAIVYYSFLESIAASANYKYELLSGCIPLAKDLDNIKFDSNVQFYTWIDCVSSSLSYFSRLSWFHKSLNSFDEVIIQPFFKYYGPALIKAFFEGCERITNEQLKNAISLSVYEFNKAQADIERVEQLFLEVLDKEITRKFDYEDKIILCLLNRFYFRCYGINEDELIYHKNKPLIISDIISKNRFLDLFKNMPRDIYINDSKISELIEAGKLQ